MKKSKGMKKQILAIGMACIMFGTALPTNILAEESVENEITREIEETQIAKETNEMISVEGKPNRKEVTQEEVFLEEDKDTFLPKEDLPHTKEDVHEKEHEIPPKEDSVKGVELEPEKELQNDEIETPVEFELEGFAMPMDILVVDTSISIDDESYVTSVGDAITLSATVEGVDDLEEWSINWESDDTSVATVVDGKVSGIANGVVTITASINDVSDTAIVKVAREIPEYDYALYAYLTVDYKGEYISMQDDRYYVSTKGSYVEHQRKYDHNGLSIDNPTVVTLLERVHYDWDMSEKLFISEYGYFEEIFGYDDASQTAVLINHKVMDDGILIESDWGDYYTFYAADEIRLTNYDLVNIFFYEDKVNWSDYYTYFDEDEVTVAVGDVTTLHLDGFQTMFADYETEGMDMDDVTIYARNLDTEVITELGTTDDFGDISFALSEEGTYAVYADGTYESSPISSAVCLITAEALDLSFDYSYYNMKIGETKSIAYDVSPSVLIDQKVLWESSDTGVATVTNDGEVYAIADGIATITGVLQTNESITATCKIIITDNPTFDVFNFSTTAFATGEWTSNQTFDSSVYTYDLLLKTYSVSSISIASTTTFDAEQYVVEVKYIDGDGVEQIRDLPTNDFETYTNFGYGTTEFIVTIREIENLENFVTYTFNITRPYSDDNVFGSGGIAVTPKDREILGTYYKGEVEGTLFQAIDGVETDNTGISSTVNEYITYFLNDLEAFQLSLTSPNTEDLMRYSVDDGITWVNVDGIITFDFDDSKKMDILIQLVSGNDKVYNDGFSNSENINEYSLCVYSVSLSSDTAQILTATAETGYISAPFSPEKYEYLVLQENGVTTDTLSYAISEGATAWIGDEEQAPDDMGAYTLKLTSSKQTIDIVSADENIVNSYIFSTYATSSADMPDYVVDYLPINSQYTNSSTYGMYPEHTLMGNAKSLGNFGGYITYYYENGIVNDPNNAYGMDFYVNGNAGSTGGSLGEVGQVWVSENNEEWYALAGSEHYEESTIWDYEVTYSRLDSGKTAWVDNQGNANSGVSNTGAYPIASNYPLHDFTGETDEIVLSGIVLPSQEDGTIMGSSTTNSFGAEVSFGYVDYYVATSYLGSGVTDTNSYTASPSKANGFDLAWAVDTEGLPIDISEKEFHYIKVVTASNIWAGSFYDKSTEVAAVVRTTPQEEAVGVTELPDSIVISSALGDISVDLVAGKTIYPVYIGDAKYVSVSVSGADDEDNIYVNNQRIASNEEASGFVVTEEATELIRVLIQNGEKEPIIYFLQLSGDATDDADGIETVYVDVAGSIREATKGSDGNYTLDVSYTIDSVGILPITTETYTINGAEVLEEYELSTGDNSFVIETELQKSILTITKGSAPTSTNTINVYVTIYGISDDEGDKEHIFSESTSGFEKILSKTLVSLSSGSTAWTALQMAMDTANVSYENATGNYITEVNGLEEFDNGPLSGWLYMVNGAYPDCGVNEYLLSNGDTILLHYTDDYTKEEASKDFSGSGSTAEDAVDAEESVIDPVTEIIQEQEVSTRFGDVSETDWYYDAVSYMVATNLLVGMSENEFAPNADMTRAMFFTVLSRMSQDKITTNGDFWYTGAMEWAMEKGITDGANPNKGITREELVTMLWRYAEKPEANQEAMEKFADVQEVAFWATEAFVWAIENGIIYGKTEVALHPKDGATRAEVAAIMSRYLQIDNEVGSVETFQEN